MIGLLALGMLLLFLLRNLISLLQGHLVGHFAQRMQLRMLLEYGHKLLRLPMTYFDSHPSGEVVSRISNVSRINGMLAYGPALTAASLLTFVVVVCSNLMFLPALRQKTRRLIVESAGNQGFLMEAFRGAQVLKTTEATPQVWDEYQSNFGTLSHLRRNTLQLSLFSSTTTNLLSSGTTLVLREATTEEFLPSVAPRMRALQRGEVITALDQADLVGMREELARIAPSGRDLVESVIDGQSGGHGVTLVDLSSKPGDPTGAVAGGAHPSRRRHEPVHGRCHGRRGRFSASGHLPGQGERLPLHFMLEQLEQPLHPACCHLTETFVGLSLLLLDLDLAEQGAMSAQFGPLRQDRFDAASLEGLAYRGGVQRQGERESHGVINSGTRGQGRAGLRSRHGHNGSWITGADHLGTVLLEVLPSRCDQAFQGGSLCTTRVPLPIEKSGRRGSGDGATVHGQQGPDVLRSTPV
ncbi:hypothetical protein I1E95_09545 [Synechococcus sp. CBW1107]|uniref:ABC transporter transmembrane domain-containing protein n=1 Tax=Synechococcus sp. CBW1107 TaxID=2789857 RepID=UPI0018CF4008|nr:ABC transporter transmembrane domain-containing protein [Synechococcus sp. CBW1107]QPN55463.1 hypothetical protein I1E95_09545 [Synechococcus sp. CBW1107]CAK6689926.1 hypothetical protein BBFGKLBO_00716 [Synechococcus sp. CBW1107]